MPAYYGKKRPHLHPGEVTMPDLEVVAGNSIDHAGYWPYIEFGPFPLRVTAELFIKKMQKEIDELVRKLLQGSSTCEVQAQPEQPGPQEPPQPGNPKDDRKHQFGDMRFKAVLNELWAMHCKKAADYGSDQDPLHNIRASSEVGIEPWRAAWLRAKDKVKRIDTFCQKGALANEGVEDSLIDLAAYSILALILFREEQGKKEIKSFIENKAPFVPRGHDDEVDAA